MKAFLATVLIAAVPALALAQNSPPPKTVGKAAVKPVAKTAPKAALAPSAQKAVEEATLIDDDPTIVLSEADLEVARKVHVGDMPCELGATVKVTPLRREGLFLVATKGHRFRMHPVESRTGAIRLEDPRRGAMWLQLGNKSMLMSQKLGQRLADECQSPVQAVFAENLKTNPQPSILEKLPEAPAPVALPAAAVASPVSPGTAADGTGCTRVVTC